MSLANNFVQYLVSKSVGPQKMAELRYNNDAKADKHMVVQATPIAVLTAGQATAGAQVGKGNICKVFGVSGTSLVVFGPAVPGSVPTTTTQNAAMLSSSNGSVLITAVDEFIRTTADVTRIEIYED